MSALRIGYVPYSESFKKPGDLRRFIAYAKARKLEFEIARPEERYDLVVLTEAADVTAWSDYPYGKVVYDLIDSYLAIPRTNVKQWLREPLWYAFGRRRQLRFDPWVAIQDMCRRADAVVCATEEQRGDILRYCSNVHVVLDVHSSVVKQSKTDYRCRTPFHLVWEGLPNNISQLREIKEVLSEVNKHTPLVLNIITDSIQPRFLGRFGCVQSLDLAREVFEAVNLFPWSEVTCSEVVRGSDLAVIPIDLSDPFARGKPENKLLLLWRMGIPVVTSATPAYERAMRNVGMDDLACKDHREWVAALEKMINSESLRRDAALRGKAFAEMHYGEESMLALWDKVFTSVGFDFHMEKLASPCPQGADA